MGEIHELFFFFGPFFGLVCRGDSWQLCALHASQRLNGLDCRLHLLGWGILAGHHRSQPTLRAWHIHCEAIGRRPWRRIWLLPPEVRQPILGSSTWTSFANLPPINSQLAGCNRQLADNEQTISRQLTANQQTIWTDNSRQFYEQVTDN